MQAILGTLAFGLILYGFALGAFWIHREMQKQPPRTEIESQYNG